MKSICLAVFAVSMAALAGCAGEAAPSSDESRTSSTASASEKAQAALDEMQSRIVLDADGKLVSPRSDVRFSATEMTIEDALAKVQPNAPISTEMRSLCSGGYGGPLLVCCTVGGQCCLHAGDHWECF